VGSLTANKERFMAWRMVNGEHLRGSLLPKRLSGELTIDVKTTELEAAA
jgi:hypothetical protein